jgi:hypothetical protein
MNRFSHGTRVRTSSPVPTMSSLPGSGITPFPNVKANSTPVVVNAVKPTIATAVIAKESCEGGVFARPLSMPSSTGTATNIVPDSGIIEISGKPKGDIPGHPGRDLIGEPSRQDAQVHGNSWMAAFLFSCYRSGDPARIPARPSSASRRVTLVRQRFSTIPTTTPQRRKPERTRRSRMVRCAKRA